MTSPRLCAAIVNQDMEAVRRVAPLVDLYEVRIDLIGQGWREVAGQLDKPWIACNRRKEEGGSWPGGEAERLAELTEAVGLGASIVDVELSTPGAADFVKEVKGRAECLLSYHNIEATPTLEELKEIVQKQREAGADICKVVTTARSLQDNVAVLRLIKESPGLKLVAFAMGEAGKLSRVLSPLAGGYFTYASVGAGKESADGQLAAAELREIYRSLDI